MEVFFNTKLTYVILHKKYDYFKIYWSNTNFVASDRNKNLCDLTVTAPKRINMSKMSVLSVKQRKTVGIGGLSYLE